MGVPAGGSESTDPEDIHKALTYAADRGMTFWDTADIYGTSEFHFFLLLKLPT